MIVLQWTVRITLLDKGTAYMGSEEEKGRQSYLLLVKLLHELQHAATAYFFKLRTHDAETRTPTVPGGIETGEGEGDALKVQNEGGKEAASVIMQTTPPKLGTIRDKSDFRGDSGNVLEELLFGARIRHRHRVKLQQYQVAS